MTFIENIGQYHRVIIFIPREVNTGGERYLVEVFKYLKHQGLQAIPIYIKQSKERHGLSLILNCLADNFRYFHQAKKVGNMSNVIFFEDFHMHPRLWLFNMLVRITTGKLRTIVLMQLALFYHNELKHRWARWLDKLLVNVFLRQSSLILTNSEFTRQEVLSIGIDPNIVKVIYCGYEGTLKGMASEANALEKKERYHILFVGQCAEYKGIEFLLRAIPMLTAKCIILDVVGNTAGEPEYFVKLSSIVEELGLKDHVTFHGHINDKTTLAQFYKRADLFILPSIVEGFGIVLLDAMSFGLPIVATRVGSIPELVKHGVNGLLVPPANPAALSKAIDHLLGSSALCEKYGQAGYNFVSEHREFYSWEAVGERALKEMESLLKESKC